MSLYDEIVGIECSVCGTKLAGKVVNKASHLGIIIFVEPCKKCCNKIVFKPEVISEPEVKVGM